MSRPSVVPRYAVTVGSLKGGTVIGKTPEERGKLHLGFQTLTLEEMKNKAKTYRAKRRLRLAAGCFDKLNMTIWKNLSFAPVISLILVCKQCLTQLTFLYNDRDIEMNDAKTPRE